MIITIFRKYPEWHLLHNNIVPLVFGMTSVVIIGAVTKFVTTLRACISFPVKETGKAEQEGTAEIRVKLGCKMNIQGDNYTVLTK